MDRWLLIVALFAALPLGTAHGAGKEAQIADQLVPRQVRVSFATEQLFVSVRSRVTPASLGETSWATWDRDGDDSLSEAELGPLLDSVTRAELGHLGVTVDGTVVPVGALRTRLEVPAERPVALDAALVLRFEGKHRTALAAGVALLDWAGLYLAILAFTAGGLTQTAWLGWRSRDLIRARLTGG